MRRCTRSLVVPLTLLLAACVSTDRRPEGTLIVAHRGASDLAPENTLAAFDLAWELGADRIEGDFHLASDGAVVAIHDKTTKRTAGIDRPVAQQSLAELRTLDVGRWKGPQWSGEGIPELSDVLATVPPGRQVLVEVKADERIVPALARIIEQSQLEPDQVIVIGFDETVITRMRQIAPELKTIWLSSFKQSDEDASWSPDAAEIIEVAQRAGAQGVGLKARTEVIDETFVRTLRDADLELHVWTVNDVDVARRMIDLGVDSITTDRPGWLREQLEH